jgi:hypothetical protein
MLIFNAYCALFALAGTGLLFVRRADRLRER